MSERRNDFPKTIPVTRTNSNHCVTIDNYDHVLAPNSGADLHAFHFVDAVLANRNMANKRLIHEK